MSVSQRPQPRIGVVLFQLGGPDSLQSVEPFLYNLFSDPDIIDFPFARVARQPLARVIAARRAKHVAHHYREIGGRSPLLENTQRQAEALERELNRTVEARVVIAMRYWHPFTAAAIDELERFAPAEVVLLPLYPQFSKTTTGSSVNEWRRRFQPNGWNPAVHLIDEFHEDSGYVGAVVESIDAALRDFPGPSPVELVFSAHSVPVAVVEAGDPYRVQVERTVELVCRAGGWDLPRHLCFQSKVGASKWLQPSMHQTIREIAARGRESVLVVPISFVSDHVETLHEIDIEHRDLAQKRGIRNFRMVPGLNDSPSFIRALANLVRSRCRMTAAS